MKYVVDPLQALYSGVGDNELCHINAPRTWLSVVTSYQHSCLGGFNHDNMMKET